MRRSWSVLLVLASMAGCAGSSAEEPAAVLATTGSAEVTESTGAIEGSVRDAEGNPLDQAQVGLEKDLFRSAVNTSADGVFVFVGLPPGEYRLLAQRIGYQSYATKVNVSVGRVAKAEVVLLPPEVPSFPLELSLYSIRSHGLWMQVPYAEAQERMPPGFRAKPHVLADPNGQTAEFAVYVMAYRNGTSSNGSVAEGYWAFEVLNVDPPAAHASGATVDFLLLASYASDPQVAALFGAWNLPTQAAAITFSPGDVASGVVRSLSSVKHEKGMYALATQNAGSTDAAVGTGITVRLFGVVDDVVVNYVNLAIGPVNYSIQGVGNAEGTGALAMAPAAPAGASYAQWGANAKQVMSFQAAKKA